jgi:hypothetical protein
VALDYGTSLRAVNLGIAICKTKDKYNVDVTPKGEEETMGQEVK